MIYSPELDFSWQQEDIYTFLPIMLSILFFVIYWFTSKSEKLKIWFFNHYEYNKATVNHVTFNRFVGFVAMGILPALFCLIFLPDYTLSDYGLTFKAGTGIFILIWTLVLTILVVPLAYFSAKKPKNLINYPMIRAKIWTKKIIFLNIFGWALYLFGYEFLFRGILLFPLAEHFGIWPAIAMNVALYSATHIPKGIEETIGALPLGLVLSLLTLASGTIWIAYLVHVIMALTNSFTAFKFHPDMHYQKSEK
jgi:membrane protease YdiL (CAAX protease family)